MRRYIQGFLLFLLLVSLASCQSAMPNMEGFPCEEDSQCGPRRKCLPSNEPGKSKQCRTVGSQDGLALERSDEKKPEEPSTTPDEVVAVEPSFEAEPTISEKAEPAAPEKVESRKESIAIEEKVVLPEPVEFDEKIRIDGGIERSREEPINIKEQLKEVPIEARPEKVEALRETLKETLREKLKEVQPEPQCTPNTSRLCYNGPAGTENIGECQKGQQNCKNGIWTPCTGAITPEIETCDGKDNNCDGNIDETFAEKGKACTVPNAKGECVKGTYTKCKQDSPKCTSTYLPTSEVCGNKIDDDCDGSIDENPPCTCPPGKTQICYTKAGGCAKSTAGYVCKGTCKSGVMTCNQSHAWGPCQGEVGPQAENCHNRKDDDCDGVVDDCACNPSAVQHSFTLPGKPSVTGGALAFTPDGRRLIIGARELHIFNLISGQIERTILLQRVQKLAIMPDGATFFAGTNTVLERHPMNAGDSENKDLSVAKYRLSYNTTGLKIHASGQTIASAQKAYVDRWYTGTLSHIKAHTLTGRVSNVVFTSDLSKAFFGTLSKEVHLFDITANKVIRKFTGHSWPIKVVALSPDEKKIASATSENDAAKTVVRVWNADTGVQLYNKPFLFKQITTLAFSPNNTKLAIGGFAKSASSGGSYRWSTLR